MTLHFKQSEFGYFCLIENNNKIIYEKNIVLPSK
jgi:hypothetical protein